MTSSPRPSNAVLSATLLAFAGLAAESRAQWCTERAEVECQQRVVVTPPPGQNWSAVRTRQFVHAWSAQYWNPVSSSYSPAGQPANFKRWGIDYYNNATDLVYNQAFLGTGPWTPAVLANRFTRLVPVGGTNPTTGNQLNANATWANSFSRIDVRPLGPMNEVDATLRTVNSYDVGNGWGYHGRAFGFGELLLELPMRWWWQPPTFQILQRMERFRVGHPACGWWIYSYYPTTPPSINVRRMRLFDPIRYTATGPDGLVLETGVLYENWIDLLSETGRITMESADGADTMAPVTFEGGDADLRIRAGGEHFYGDSGELHISVRNGVVTESWGTGPWTWSAPPVGLVTPFTVAIQTEVRGTLDLSHLIGREFALTIGTSDGGVQPPEIEPDVPPPSCAADFNNDGFLDFFDIDEFTRSFEGGDMRADFNGDGFLDFFDMDGFTVAFEAGC